MDKVVAQQLNEILAKQNWLVVVTPLTSDASGRLQGFIRIPTPKGNLEFEINVRRDYPLDTAGFYCRSHKGYPHMMGDGLLCLLTPAATTAEGKLCLELDKLQMWVQRYFIEGYIDAHFEYYMAPKYENPTLIFQEASSALPPNQSFGTFEYVVQRSEPVDNDIIYQTYLSLGLGGRNSEWPAHLHEQRQKFTGGWIFLDRHPITTGRHLCQNWQELLPLLSLAQQRFLYDNRYRLARNSERPNQILIALGYCIPSPSGTELHWDALLVSIEPFPWLPQKIGPGLYQAVARDLHLPWIRTVNASYERLFGRGALSPILTEAKILVIGTGAIGSSLLEALVRGGCKTITISDGDDTEPGNICRGKFYFSGMVQSKVMHLASELVCISPYLDLEIWFEAKAMLPDNPDYAELQRKLNDFDFIFDCSTNKPVSIMLDGMRLKGQVINLSISNGAEHLVIITGYGHIHQLKSSLYDRISPQNPEPFFVATGCYHPTFQASYADINAPLMMALNELNSRLQNGIQVQSFYIQRGLTSSHSITYTVNYEV